MSIRSMKQGSENGSHPDDESSPISGVSGGQKQIQPGKTNDAADGLMKVEGNQHQSPITPYKKGTTLNGSSKPCTDQMGILADSKLVSRSPIKDPARKGKKRASKLGKNEIRVNAMAKDETNDKQNLGDPSGADNKKDHNVMFSNVVNTHGDISPQKSLESIDDNVTNINNINDNNQ
jgi:hypothetical protein